MTFHILGAFFVVTTLRQSLPTFPISFLPFIPVQPSVFPFLFIKFFSHPSLILFDLRELGSRFGETMRCPSLYRYCTVSIKIYGSVSNYRDNYVLVLGNNYSFFFCYLLCLGPQTYKVFNKYFTLVSSWFIHYQLRHLDFSLKVENFWKWRWIAP